MRKNISTTYYNIFALFFYDFVNFSLTNDYKIINLRF